MKNRRNTNFFKAMVMMGSGLALHCGGATERDHGPAPSASGGTGGSAGSSGTGGSAGSAGTTSAGGTSGTAGTAGSGGSGGARPEPPACPPAQWNCPESFLCGYPNDAGTYGWMLPDDCTCNPSRPLSPDDCEAGASYVCKMGTALPDESPLLGVQPFQCACVAAADLCSQECSEALGDLANSYECAEEPGDPESILCGCAYVLLR